MIFNIQYLGVVKQSERWAEWLEWCEEAGQVFMAMCHHENIGDGNCWRLVVLVITANFSQIVDNRESSPKTAGDRSESPAPSLHLNIPNLEVETDQGGLKTKTKLISPLASPNNSRVALKIDDNHTGKILLLTCHFRSCQAHTFSLLREGGCFGHAYFWSQTYLEKND